MVCMVSYFRGPRDELIRRLRAQGLSLRAIAVHPDVVAANMGQKLSVGAVHGIVHAADRSDDDEWGAPAVVDDPDALEADLERRYPVVEVGKPDPVRDAAYLWKLIDKCFPAGRGGPMVKDSSLYKLLFTVRSGLRVIVVRDDLMTGDPVGAGSRA
jgi:hypothetical protein